MTYTINDQPADERDVYEYMMSGEDAFSDEEAAQILGRNWKRARFGTDEEHIWVERS